MAKNGQYTRLGSRTSFVIQAGENDFWIFLDSKLNLCSTLRSTLTTVTDFFQAIQFTHVSSMLGFTWKDHNPLQLEKAFPLPLDFLQENFTLLDKEVVIIGHYI